MAFSNPWRLFLDPQFYQGAVPQLPSPSICLSGCPPRTVKVSLTQDLVTQPNSSPKESQCWLPGHLIRFYLSLIWGGERKIISWAFTAFRHTEIEPSVLFLRHETSSQHWWPRTVWFLNQRDIYFCHYQVLTVSWVGESLSDSSKGGFKSAGGVLQRLYCS